MSEDRRSGRAGALHAGGGRPGQAPASRHQGGRRRGKEPTKPSVYNMYI